MKKDKILKNHEMLCLWWTLYYTTITVLASSDAIVDNKRALYFRSRFPQQLYIFIHLEKTAQLYSPK